MRARSVVAILAVLGAAALADDSYKGPLEHAKAGQWVQYKMANDMRMRQSIVKVDGAKITIKNEMWIKDKALPAMETPVDLSKRADAGGDKPAKAEATKAEEAPPIEVGGRSFKCRVVTQGSVKTWLSEQVPITGVVKVELNGTVAMELTGYGQSEGEDLLKK